MGQIVKTKKKGRPSKADLAVRRASAATVGEEALEDEEHQRDIRRSLRRRNNVRYSILDYDEEDYLDDEEEFNGAEEEEGEEDEEEEDEDEGERRREKKLKFVLKLPSSNHHHHSHQRRGRGRPSRGVGYSAHWNRPVGPRPALDSDEDDEREAEESEEGEENSVKKRKISGGNSGGDIDYDENEDNEDKEKKEESKRGDSVPGTPDDTPSNTPMPEKKQLELILDRLQKKDTYGVYAEPVDPEELPDYHEIIEHPMDFATVRKKLANGSYALLEHFESDVFLICSNAMLYNPAETIYHKQARAIKELAERKFQHVRAHIERSLKETKTEENIPKVEEKIKPAPIVKKQAKKPITQSMQDPVGSDFSSGATLATADVNTASNVVQSGNSERPSNSDGHVEGISPMVDNNVEKVEDLSGKGLHLKFGKKSFVVDENRRATYDISNQPVDRSDSIFTTFENEQKQLIPVGVAGEHSYARSLARFAATLGPVAWGIASQKIEQALPPGFRYGRGWVVEYEPIATSVLVLKSFIQNEQPLNTKVQNAAVSGTNDNFPNTPHSSNELSGNRHGPDGLFGSGMSKPPTPTGDNRPKSDGKSYSLFGSGGCRPTTPSHDNGPRLDRKSSSLVGSGRSKPPAPSTSSGNGSRTGGKSSLIGSGGSKQPKPTHSKGPRLDGKSSLNGSGGGTSTNVNQLRLDEKPSSFIGPGESNSSTPTGAFMQQYNPFSQSALGIEGKIAKRQSTTNLEADHFRQNQIPSSLETYNSQPVEPVMKNNSFLHPLPLKQPATNGAVPNGKFITSVDINRSIGSPASVLPLQAVGSTACVSQRPDQGLSDPVQVMRMLTEKAQRQQNGSNPSFGLRASVPSPRGANTGNTAAAAASAWMSVGDGGFKDASENASNQRSHISADSLYSKSREFHPPILQQKSEFPAFGTMHFLSDKKIRPFQAFVPQERVGNEAQVPNRPFFPQPVAVDSPGFQAQSTPWRGLNPLTQHQQKQDTLPPDLNIAFQSSVDSQQPDLALQL